MNIVGDDVDDLVDGEVRCNFSLYVMVALDHLDV